MQVRIWPASLPPPMASKAMVAPVSTSALVRSSMKVGDGGIDDMLGADLAQDVGLLRAAHDVDEADAVLEADLVEHLAEVGGGRGMHQRLVALAPHGLGHAERGQRIDEAGGAVGRRRAGRQRQARRVAFRQRYCAYIAPPIIATVLPISALAASDDPVLITTPAPSLPTGIDSSSRPAIARIAGFRHLRGDDGRVLGAGRPWRSTCRRRRSEGRGRTD